MARSSWKGKVFAPELVKPIYLVAPESIQFYRQYVILGQLQNRKPDLVQLYKRNHVLLPSHDELQGLPFSLYTGYDHITSVSESLDNNFSKLLGLNLAAAITTRETKVVHKVKMSKAARKAQTKRRVIRKPSSKNTKRVNLLRGKMTKRFKR